MTQPPRPLLFHLRPRHLAAFAAASLLLAGCAMHTVQWENRQAAQTLAEAAQPPGSVYMGWRVFQDRCAQCHGPAATGTARAPDLLPRVRAMSERRFVAVVLQRYDWNRPGEQVQGAATPHDTLIEAVIARQDAPLNMPAWQGEPRVNAHIVDLYAYLSARANGGQGPERPTP